VILRETNRIVKMERGHLIVETGPGWVCANAGVDESNNLGPDTVICAARPRRFGGSDPESREPGRRRRQSR
jgi:F420-0:gamma-glutamyl ligase